MAIISYLLFNGNCREAMNFYKKCLGGKLSFQTIGESPLSGKMPAKMKNCILHATLSNDDLLLAGSDLVPEPGLIKGNAISLSLRCNSEKEFNRIFQNLSSGGNITHPAKKTFWGAKLSEFTDRFGYHWLLYFDRDSAINSQLGINHQ